MKIMDNHGHLASADYVIMDVCISMIIPGNCWQLRYDVISKSHHIFSHIIYFIQFYFAEEALDSNMKIKMNSQLTSLKKVKTTPFLYSFIYIIFWNIWKWREQFLSPFLCGYRKGFNKQYALTCYDWKTEKKSWMAKNEVSLELFWWI